jgi:hypothetical protein
MILYLAGGISGNCKPMWTDLIKAERGGKLDVYLAGINGRTWCVDLYLAGTMYGNNGKFLNRHEKDMPPMIDLSILESFYYADEWTEWAIPRLRNFMLDSGVFTMAYGSGQKVDFDQYTERYIEFINKNDVKLFFEMDIDDIAGLPKAEELRRKIERGTGKQPIPIFHRNRGKEYFIDMCKNYPYVAIGGIAGKGNMSARKEYMPYFQWFIDTAHKHGAKIHGLGFTDLKALEVFNFDSVDSTSWTTGNRFGAIYRFNGKTMVKYGKKDGQRLKDARAVAINNFNEWVKFQHYARKNL